MLSSYIIEILFQLVGFSLWKWMFLFQVMESPLRTDSRNNDMVRIEFKD